MLPTEAGVQLLRLLRQSADRMPGNVPMTDVGPRELHRSHR